MRRTSMILGLCAALAFSAPSAGDKEEGGSPKKCNETMESCLQSMVDRFKRTGLIGLDGEWDEALGGYKIERFIEGSVGASAGMQIGDVLIKVNGIPLSDEKRAKADAENRRPGSEATATVLREGREITFHVKLIAVPADVMAEEIGRHMIEYHAPESAARGQ